MLNILNNEADTGTGPSLICMKLLHQFTKIMLLSDQLSLLKPSHLTAILS